MSEAGNRPFVLYTDEFREVVGVRGLPFKFDEDVPPPEEEEGESSDQP